MTSGGPEPPSGVEREPFKLRFDPNAPMPVWDFGTWLRPTLLYWRLRWAWISWGWPWRVPCDVVRHVRRPTKRDMEHAEEVARRLGFYTEDAQASDSKRRSKTEEAGR
jgi:hypothetical protein